MPIFSKSYLCCTDYWDILVRNYWMRIIWRVWKALRGRDIVDEHCRKCVCLNNLYAFTFKRIWNIQADKSFKFDQFPSVSSKLWWENSFREGYSCIVCISLLPIVSVFLNTFGDGRWWSTVAEWIVPHDAAVLHTEKSFRNVIESTRNQIVFTNFWFIWISKWTEISLCTQGVPISVSCKLH